MPASSSTRATTLRGGGFVGGVGAEVRVERVELVGRHERVARDLERHAAARPSRWARAPPWASPARPSAPPCRWARRRRASNRRAVRRMPRRGARGRRNGCVGAGSGAACDEPYQPCRVGFAGDSRRPLARPVRPRERARRATSGGRRRRRARPHARAGDPRTPQAARARRLGVEHRDARGEAARVEPARDRDRARRGSWPASTASRAPRWPARDSSTSASTRRRPARSPRRSSTPGPAYGHSDTLAGDGRINLEFVSANPTGPLHIGHTRWAALGDSIGRVLRAAGAEVANEYYINDAGTQMDNFGLSVLAAAKGEPTPEGGYPGSYIADLAARVLEREPKLLELDEAVALHTATEIAYELQLGEIRASLDRFNVHFDVWTSERRMQVKGDDGLSDVDTAVERLRAQGHVFDEDDAVWVRTTDFGDDKDRVIRRSNGAYTYFAADAAYYLDKGDRGFGHKIYLLGADHHGYVHRLPRARRGGGRRPRARHRGAHRPAREHQRREALEARRQHHRARRPAGLARHRCAALHARALPGRLAAHHRPRDPAPAARNDNPVFYVQYAHARTRRGRPQRGIRRRRPLVVRARAARRTRRSRRCSARCRSSRASSRRPPSCASRIASRATSRSSRGSTTAGTTTAGCSRSATSRSATCTARASG